MKWPWQKPKRPMTEKEQNRETVRILAKDPQTAAYIPIFNKYASVRERIAEEQHVKPVPKEGEFSCIECYGHGILREFGDRIGTFGGGYNYNLKCEYCGHIEPMHKMAPWEFELMMRSGFSTTCPKIELKLQEEPITVYPKPKDA